MAKRKDFSELTRVQIPAALHLMRLGYTYLPHNGKILNERDPETNILVSVFRDQFLKFNNYATDEDVDRELSNIKLELDQNDLGRSFFKRLQGQENTVYIDWENPEANTFHLALEVTCHNGQDEFRPDVVVFINGLPFLISKSNSQMLSEMARRGFSQSRIEPDIVLRIASSVASITLLN